MNRPERERQHPRYAHEATVKFVTKTATVEGRTNNISRGGLSALLASPLKVGAEVDVDIALVFEEGNTSEPLRLPARVVWCTHLDDEHQVGLMFRPLDAERTEYLTMLLRYLSDGVTAKRDSLADSSIDDRFR